MGNFNKLLLGHGLYREEKVTNPILMKLVLITGLPSLEILWAIHGVMMGSLVLNATQE